MRDTKGRGSESFDFRVRIRISTTTLLVRSHISPSSRLAALFSGCITVLLFSWNESASQRSNGYGSTTTKHMTTKTAKLRSVAYDRYANTEIAGVKIPQLHRMEVSCDALKSHLKKKPALRFHRW